MDPVFDLIIEDFANSLGLDDSDSTSSSDCFIVQDVGGFSPLKRLQKKTCIDSSVQIILSDSEEGENEYFHPAPVSPQLSNNPSRSAKSKAMGSIQRDRKSKKNDLYPAGSPGRLFWKRPGAWLEKSLDITPAKKYKGNDEYDMFDGFIDDGLDFGVPTVIDLEDTSSEASISFHSMEDETSESIVFLGGNSEEDLVTPIIEDSSIKEDTVVPIIEDSSKDEPLEPILNSPPPKDRPRLVQPSKILLEDKPVPQFRFRKEEKDSDVTILEPPRSSLVSMPKTPPLVVREEVAILLCSPDSSYMSPARIKDPKEKYQHLVKAHPNTCQDRSDKWNLSTLAVVDKENVWEGIVANQRLIYNQYKKLAIDPAFKQQRERLAREYYAHFNDKVYDNKLPGDLPISWEIKKGAAGFCSCSRVGNVFTVKKIGLNPNNNKTDAEMRSTLLHEMCHAAAWIFDRCGGHGRPWLRYVKLSERKVPESAPVGKSLFSGWEYPYFCSNKDCKREYFSHSRSTRKNCGTCKYPVVLPPSWAEPARYSKPLNPFAIFVKHHYGTIKEKSPTLSHKEVMKELSFMYKASK